jgi:DtxR family Mn-dependent transcriptional regulator
MLRKLADKKLIAYEKYRKIELTKSGKQLAILVIRKHRLWEVFLHEKLQFGWDEVHEIAEQLEHIQSEELITRLERFLGFPKFDPHGDPIPSANGELHAGQRITLSDVQINKSCEVVGVNDSSAVFLKYLQQVDIGIGTKIKVLEKISFDGSMAISLPRKVSISVSKKFADNLMVIL